MGITWEYGHSICGESFTNNIDRFEAVPRKKISSLRGHLHKCVNTVVASYGMYPRHISCFRVPKGNMETLSLRENDQFKPIQGQLFTLTFVLYFYN